MRSFSIALMLVAGCGSTELSLGPDGAAGVDTGAVGMIATPDAAAADVSPGKAPADDAAPAKPPLPDAMKAGGGDPDAGKGGGDEGSGKPVTNPAAPGVGPCAGKTLADVIAAVHKLNPMLADISYLEGMDPNIGGDGNRIFAFAHDKGFRLVFKRGANDCPAGCIDNRYWYFATNEQCQPVQEGYYERAYQAAGNCFQVQGKPLWGLPPALDPVHQCGADNSPQDISGQYKVRAAGTRMACTAKRGDEPVEKVSFELVVTVKQMAGELAKGTVVVTGTGNPGLDGVVLPATFQRRRLSVSHRTDNLPATCLEQTETTLSLDFETDQPGKLSFFEVRALACPPGQDYCKGQLTLELAPGK